MANKSYKATTLNDIINCVLSNPKIFPKGFDTVVVSGDLEGNYTHMMHIIQNYQGNICLGYEMHEGMNC